MIPIPDERLTLSVVEAARALGISRASAYSAIHEGRIPAIRVSKRRLVVPVSALRRLLDEAGVSGTGGPKA
jgi:excisionase family DNA binding protein